MTFKYAKEKPHAVEVSECNADRHLKYGNHQRLLAASCNQHVTRDCNTGNEYPQ